MITFTKKQKNMAKCGEDYLKSRYAESEKSLIIASKLGDKKLLDECMKDHRDYEYALLYRYTPEFKKSVRVKK